MAKITRSPEGTEFEDDEGHAWHCLNCGRTATGDRFCDYCEFPRYNQPDEEWLPTGGHVTRDTPPTDPPEGVDPGSHGGML